MSLTSDHLRVRLTDWRNIDLHWLSRTKTSRLHWRRNEYIDSCCLRANCTSGK